METEALKLPGQDVRKLLAAANGDAALLYLYEQSGLPRAEAMERLRMTQTRYDLAAATLQQMGLWQEETKRFFAPAEAPHYTEEDVTHEYHAGPEFPSMVGEAQRRLGRILSTEELKILLCIYRYLGLAPEVISILISYCIQRGHARGVSRMPSIRTIEKEAYRWADLGIETMEQAAAYMQQALRRQSRAGRIAEILQTGPRLTPGEEKYVRDWIDWGFDDDVIAKAYEKTRLSTGALKWPYLNAILRSWHEQGFTTLSQVEAGDQKPASRPAAQKNAVQRHGGELSGVEKEAVERMLRKELSKED